MPSYPITIIHYRGLYGAMVDREFTCVGRAMQWLRMAGLQNRNDVQVYTFIPKESDL